MKAFDCVEKINGKNERSLLTQAKNLTQAKKLASKILVGAKVIAIYDDNNKLLSVKGNGRWLDV